MIFHYTSRPSEPLGAGVVGCSNRLDHPHHLHNAFAARVLPTIDRQTHIYFRHIKCPERKADLIAEAIGLAWKWFRRMSKRSKGEDGTRFPTAIATFQEKGKDVLSPHAQRRRGFLAEKLPDFSTLSSNPLAETLHDNPVSPFDEQAPFRIDFPVWLDTFNSRGRNIILAMATGHRTQELAERYGLSPSRISQMRAEAPDDRHDFHDEQPA